MKKLVQKQIKIFRNDTIVKFSRRTTTINFLLHYYSRIPLDSNDRSDNSKRKECNLHRHWLREVQGGTCFVAFSQSDTSVLWYSGNHNN